MIPGRRDIMWKYLIQKMNRFGNVTKLPNEQNDNQAKRRKLGFDSFHNDMYLETHQNSTSYNNEQKLFHYYFFFFSYQTKVKNIMHFFVQNNDSKTYGRGSFGKKFRLK